MGEGELVAPLETYGDGVGKRRFRIIRGAKDVSSPIGWERAGVRAFRKLFSMNYPAFT
jgi:hypothetical protein